ncbi:MAG: site-2 protease family protein [Sphaerobacter sp.]|nr:site-2 protease family protein [Sphaerobacter sp.]
MGRGLRIATVRGIDIKLHPSFLLALLWVTYYWGIAPDRGLRGVLFGVFILIAVFVSVVGHELAHGFVALRFGLTVHDITLLPIGGVARIEQVPLPPRREAAVALAGPLLNVLVAIGLLPVVLVIAVASDVRSWYDLLLLVHGIDGRSFLLHLWIANLMLAAFNLLPAFPMDGGRLLRALLTGVSNRLLATRIAVALGQILALALIVAGFYTRDVALPLVSIFIILAAFVEARMILVESALQSLPVGQFAVWDAGGVSPDSPLSHAVLGGPRDLAVTHQGMVVGMLWRDDVLSLLSRGHSLRVADIMDRNVTAMDVDSSVYEVHRRMLATGRPAIPITEGGLYRGIFTSDRLVHVHRYLQQRFGTRDRYRGLIEALGLLGR